MPQILRKDPLHRLPGCWYVEGSRMLRNLDERTVEAMARQSALATYAPGELLQRAGEPMSAVTFISAGRVKVYRASRDGKQQTIALLGPGDAFGEIGIVDTSAQDLYVEALEETVVCRTTREAFLRLCSRALPWRSDWRRAWARSSRMPASGSPTSPSWTSAAESRTCS